MAMAKRPNSIKDLGEIIEFLCLLAIFVLSDFVRMFLI